MNKRMLLTGLLTAFMMGGCASVPMSSLDEDAKAKRFEPAKETSSIYLYRNETFGGAIPLTVALDGRVAGQTGPQTYFLWEVVPGEHEVSSLSENTAYLKLRTEPGKAYYVWQEVKMGLWMARSQLHQVDDATGRAGVQECQRAQSNF
jgi:hypothetical protein